MFSIRTILIVHLIILPAAALSYSYYISPDGNDSWPGTLLYPFASIQRAESSSAPGDTINVMSGVYYETVFIHQSGTIDAPIVYRVPEGEYATVKAQENFCFFIKEEREYIVIEGFYLTLGYYSTEVAHGAGIRCHGNHCTFKNNHCYDNDMGVFIETFTEDTSICNYGNVVRDNIFSDNGEAGVRIKRSDKNSVINNLFYHNGYRIEPAGAMTYYGADSTVIMNNTFWDNGGPCIHNYNGTDQEMTPVTTHTLLANNICVDVNGGILFRVDENMMNDSTNLYRNNLWWNGSPGSDMVMWGYDNLGYDNPQTQGVDLNFTHYLIEAGLLNPECGTGALEADPMFNDGWGLELSLLAGSLGIDAGYSTLELLELTGLTAAANNLPDDNPPDLGFHFEPYMYVLNPAVDYPLSFTIRPNPVGGTAVFHVVLAPANNPIIPKIRIFNILGQEVAFLKPTGDSPVNNFIITWQPPDNLAAGIYFAYLSAPGLKGGKRIVLLK
ncbi:right-handed parallel beta-helix repeat-containing protein [bacterium]|nr:right-handed parallel beta-helix repeat-containing protein [FCB group bacterium]MBL7191704.1 right-handed parallel beta-helix repeat-containing protein [bacterium]